MFLTRNNDGLRRSVGYVSIPSNRGSVSDRQYKYSPKTSPKSLNPL
ncbi:hypothetical protein MTBBW1_1350003 [Desulfamplus magnetovallimortis]|uniref:Uncharacterized protein n=1 Tax=Desulfamplus magnetovallimortis TaxID=1246637 RepID=A0A1W1H7H7_9BACT|nr:hypothetical protein MTBBW1_1350003 [Desulfamplus magnetovallimortis]